MWIACEHGFYSVVRECREPFRLIVRARSYEDLERFVKLTTQEVQIFETLDADYPYRVFIPTELAEAVISRITYGISYPNFKNRVKQDNPKRAKTYEKVWATLRSIEEE